MWWNQYRKEITRDNWLQMESIKDLSKSTSDCYKQKAPPRALTGSSKTSVMLINSQLNKLRHCLSYLSRGLPRYIVSRQLDRKTRTTEKRITLRRQRCVLTEHDNWTTGPAPSFALQPAKLCRTEVQSRHKRAI